MIKLVALAGLIFLVSCSGTSLKNLFGSSHDSTERNEELLKDFETEKDVMEKFAVKKEKVDPEKKKVKKVKPKKVSSKIKSKKRVALKKKPVKKKTSPSKKEVKKEVGFVYPVDTPEEFKDLDYESEKYWSQYKPYLIQGEKAVFAIKYGIISTGNITIETKEDGQIGDQEAFHIQARIKTSDYYSYLYELDDLCDSFVRKTDFIPLKFSLIQRESSQDVDDLQLFDLDELKNYSFYKRVTKEKTKKEKKVRMIPRYFQDPLSLMYFVRGLPMKIGAEYAIPFANKGKIEMLNAKVEKVETISTKIGRKEAYKVAMETTHSGKTIKGGKMTFWFATDETRIFLKFNAKIKIGSISGDLLEYKHP